MNLKHTILRLWLNLKQRTSRLLGVITVCLAALFGLNPSANAEIVRVRASAPSCPGDGISWGTAYKYLQDALDAASQPGSPITEIWVAAGEYFVDQSCANEVGTGDRTETFQLVKDVFLLGGFNGTEFDADERDPVFNITILSGDWREAGMRKVPIAGCLIGRGRGGDEKNFPSRARFRQNRRI